MVFTSFDYLFYFPVVTAVYFALKPSLRWVWLLAASCWFYAAFIPAYLLILFLLIGIDYSAGLLMECADRSWRRVWLLLSLASNIGILGVFKYYNFFHGNLAAVMSWVGATNPLPIFHWVLPIGLSFHTFQSIGYVIDVYRGQRSAERHLGYYALYVMFFPQLVAGPIERSTRLLPQLRAAHVFDSRRVVSGLRLILSGFVMKLVAADRLSLFVDRVYSAPAGFDALSLLIATVFFAFQIYCDFYAYSLIALGSARCLGIELMANFNAPYSAVSVSDFWRRWHVSLSSWFRDYVYVPLGGNKGPLGLHVRNLFVVFLLSGLWHGANWTFVIWGLLHGTYISTASLWNAWVSPWKERLSLGAGAGAIFFRRLRTFALLCLSWVFFRADSLQQSVAILRAVFSGFLHGTTLFSHFQFARFEMSEMEWGIAVLVLVVMMALELRPAGISWDAWLEARPRWQRWGIYYLQLLLLCFFGVFQTKPFIYFQF